MERRYRHSITGEVPFGVVFNYLAQHRWGAQWRNATLLSQVDTARAGWQSVNDFFEVLSITKVAHDPRHPDTIYFCTGEGWYNWDAVRGAGVWRSTDGGRTWQLLPTTSTPEFYYCQDLQVHPLTGDVYACTRSGLWRSTDAGNSWQLVFSAVNSPYCADIEINSTGMLFASFGFVVDRGRLYRSPTGNPGTWTPSMGGDLSAPEVLNRLDRIELAIAPSDEAVMYVLAAASDDSILGVFRSVDTGRTWTQMSLPGGDRRFANAQASYDLIIAVAPHNPNLIVAGGIDLWASTDGAVSWIRLSNGHAPYQPQYVHVDQHEIIFISPDTVIFSNDGGVWASFDFSSALHNNRTPTIISLNWGYRTTQFYTTAVPPQPELNIILGGTQDNGSQLVWQAGISPALEVSWADGSFCTFNPLNPQMMFTSKQWRTLYRVTLSQDFSQVLQRDTIPNPNVSDNDVQFINPILLDPNSPNTLYQLSVKGLWRLPDAWNADSTHWERASAPFTGIGVYGVSAFAISTTPPGIVFVGAEMYNPLGRSQPAHIWRIDNIATADSTTQPIRIDRGQLPARWYLYTSCIAVDPNDANHIVVSFGNFGVPHVWESWNALSDTPTWRNISGDLPDLPVHWAVIHPRRPELIYIASDAGVFFAITTDTPIRWRRTVDSMGNVSVWMLAIRTSDWKIVAATHGRGFFEALLDSTGMNPWLVWRERGPYQVGGRTRTVLPVRQPNGRLALFAASVSGGLWWIRDISEAMEPPSPPPTPPPSAPPLELLIYPQVIQTGNIIRVWVGNVTERWQLLLIAVDGKTIYKSREFEAQQAGQWHPLTVAETLTPGVYQIVLRTSGGNLAKSWLLRL